MASHNIGIEMGNLSNHKYAAAKLARFVLLIGLLLCLMAGCSIRVVAGAQQQTGTKLYTKW